MDRRRFLKLAGSLGAAAAIEGCARGGERLEGYAAPDGEAVLPGVSVEYATVCRECPAGCGLLASVRDGRVHQVRGNPQHPINRGGICVRGQSSLQALYDPDRIPGPLARDGGGPPRRVGWQEADRRLQDAIARARGTTAAWIGQLETGALDRLIGAWLGALFPGALRLRYEAFAYEPLRTAVGRVFGRPMVPDFRIADARMLLCFGAEFLEAWISNVEYARLFGEWRAARAAGGPQGRYVFIAPRLSMTGANADEWIPVRPGSEGLVAQALSTMAGGGAGRVGGLAAAAGVPVATLERLGREMAGSAPFLALPLGISGEGPGSAAAQEAVLRLNGTGGLVVPEPHALSAAATHRDALDLVERMRRGEIGVLFVHRANPAYSLPASFGSSEAAARVPLVVSFTSHPDETTALASLVLPDHTPLESWGDYSPRPGVTGLMQPATGPVFETRALGDTLIVSAREAGHDLGATSFEGYLRRSYPMGDAAWQSALQSGGIYGPRGATAGAPPGAAGGRRPAPVRSSAAVGARPAQALPHPAERIPGASGALLTLYPTVQLFDGRTANRPWAQEIPEPMAKGVWGSWAEIHPDLAVRLGVETGDLLRLGTPSGQVDVPALITDRVHPEAVAVQMGQGHTAYGRTAEGTGANALALVPATLDAASGAPARSGIPVTVNALPVVRPPVVLQTGFRNVNVPIARSVALSNPASREKAPVPIPQVRDPGESLYLNPLRGARHWGMAIDLNRCIGCNACVAACYAENNVPVVGREQCARGREMSWLRIENYIGSTQRYDGNAGTMPLDTRFLPMLCQHCQNAPCEYVCPVNATMHNEDGLNQQVYNRCVGTRYCSNNCPYKVRRFNWFSFAFPAPLDRQLNPDVTRRRKGVMEKCSFCIQRIRAHEIAARAEGRALRDGEVQTACQQACPTGAILFGDYQDQSSRVRQAAGQARGYGALAELNTYPNIVYLSRVRAT